MTKAQPPTASDISKIAQEPMIKMDALGQSRAERDCAWADASFTNWSGEIQRYYGELTSQAMNTFEQLRSCRTPFDVLMVEREWWAARSKAYLESGVRLAQTFAEISAKLGAPPGA